MIRRLLWLSLVVAGTGCAAPGHTPLTAAAAAGEAEAVEALLREGADPDQADGRGWPALAWAARGGHLRAAAALLAAGADPDQPDRYVNGWSPLQHALHKRQLGAAKLLLDHGADPNFRSRGAVTPLFLAAGYGDADAVRLLLGRGADPRVDLGPGQNLLAAAVGGAWDIDYRWSGCEPHTQVVRALLDRAPDLDIGDGFWSWQALRTARRNGCSELLALVRGSS
jgi:ankyrin repeat protein